MVRCLDYTYDCFRCGNRVHKMRYCLTLKAKGKEVNQAPYGGPNPNALKRNRFYALGAKKGTNSE